MHPLVVVPAALLSFLTGAALGVGRRRPLSMLPPDEIRSPLPGVPVAAWRRFVALMVVAPKGATGPRGKLGYFGMTTRSLADVGMVEVPHKITVGGERGVWAGTWKPPFSKDTFLGSTRLQYEAFARSASLLGPKLSSLVGVPIGPKRATLSGLLGVAHLAGERGVEGWVRNQEVRDRFRATTDNFHRTNGVF